LRNYDSNAVVSPLATPKEPMVVDSIIGTSGGAMLALFAAQLSPLTPDTAPGQNLVLTDLLTEVSAKALFPPADLPRVLSVALILALLFVCVSFARLFTRRRHGKFATRPITKDRPWLVLIAELLLILAGAFAIVTTRSPDLENAKGTEGVLYAFLVMTAHLGMSCIGKAPLRARPSTTDRLLVRCSVAGAGLGVMMLGVAVAMSTLSADNVDRNHFAASAAPLLAVLGLCVISIAIITGAAGGIFKLALEPRRLEEYIRALAVTAVVVVASYGIVVIAAARGWTSTLELTTSYWRWMIGAGLTTAMIVIVVAARGSGRIAVFLRKGLWGLMRDRRGAVTTTLVGSIGRVMVFAIICWIVIVAPAIYGNDYAWRALREAQEKVAATRNRVEFTSNLIVTGSLLADNSCLRRGDLYFCFGGAGGCGASTHGAWQTFEMSVPERALDAVFASGSPFPVFSPHRTHLSNGCAVPLVDGGYTHNVPLEAASLTETRQVLVLNASPQDDESELRFAGADGGGGLWQMAPSPSQLVRSGSRILDFMFARAQELDRSVSGNLMVASLSPRPHGPWASLLDFTPGTRRRVVEEAARDIAENRRIGRIESWGLPLVTARLGPDGSPLRARGWTPEVRAEIERVVGAASENDVVALDLDNTILRGNLGEAVLLKLIVDFRYPGHQDDFWDVFENQRAAHELRAYWKQFAGAERRVTVSDAYFAPERWSHEFADYVVLFLRQYQELLGSAGGAARARAWIARLMSGMAPGTIRTLVRELWEAEMARGEAPVKIFSAKYGDVEVQGGLRVHDEMKTLIKDLQDRGTQVWVVTTTSEPVAYPIADLLRVPAGRVIGFPLPVTTSGARLDFTAMSAESKAELFRRKGLHPVLAIGDSSPELLAAAVPGRQVIVVSRDNRPSRPIQPLDLLSTIELSTEQ
jgi:hypothetical protein